MKRRGSWSALFAALLLGGALACSDALGPPYGEAARYALPDSVVYACGTWSPARPTADVGLFDVYYGAAGAGPTAEDLRRIAEARGAVVTPFHLRGARVVVPVAEVPRLYGNLVVGVTDASIIVHRVFVGLRTAADSVVITHHGGRVITVWPSITAAYAAVADAAIPALRGEARVRYVEADGVACPAVR